MGPSHYQNGQILAFICLIMVSLAVILEIKVAILQLVKIALARIDFITRKFRRKMFEVLYLFPKVYNCCKNRKTLLCIKKTMVIEVWLSKSKSTGKAKFRSIYRSMFLPRIVMGDSSSIGIVLIISRWPTGEQL